MFSKFSTADELGLAQEIEGNLLEHGVTFPQEMAPNARQVSLKFPFFSSLSGGTSKYPLILACLFAISRFLVDRSEPSPGEI